jgi:Na+/proline symporter
MAATSACSAELISVSSIVTRDIVGLTGRTLSGKKAVLVSEITIGIFAVWAGCWSFILDRSGVDLGWLFYVQVRKRLFSHCEEIGAHLLLSHF